MIYIYSIINQILDRGIYLAFQQAKIWHKVILMWDARQEMNLPHNGFKKYFDSICIPL